MSLIYEITFPDNNGSKNLTLTLNESTLDIEYEFNALTRRHLFNVSNEGFEVKDVIAQTGGCLNETGKGICKLFVIVHSMLFGGVEGYCEEFPAGSLVLYVMDRESMDNYYKTLTEVLEK